VSVFIDTSALLAILDRDDQAHEPAGAIWTQLVEQNVQLATTNYILVETNALVQRRLGMRIVHVFEEQMMPLLAVIWIDEGLHRSGVTLMRAANRRRLSLIDCVSFAVCRKVNVQRVFAFDRHFAEQGFEILLAD